MIDEKAPRTIDLLPGNPCRPPGWRRLRAAQLACRDDRRRRWDDGWVIRARRFLTAPDRAGGDPGHPRLAVLDPPVFGAFDLWRGDARRRWEAEARLLAGQTDGEISGRLGIAAGMVEAYEALFYAVRDRLEARDWVFFQAIGPRVYEAFDSDDLEIIWKLFAYNCGPFVLDVLLNASPGRPEGGECSAVDPRLAPLVELLLKVTTLSAAPEDGVALIRLDALARQLDLAESARAVSPMMKPIVAGPIEVRFKPRSTGVAPAVSVMIDREMPGIRDTTSQAVTIPDHLDAEGRHLRSTG